MSQNERIGDIRISTKTKREVLSLLGYHCASAVNTATKTTTLFFNNVLHGYKHSIAQLSFHLLTSIARSREDPRKI